MTAYVTENNSIVISSDDARGGETGHNVRFVLEFGLAGIILAFAAVAVYAGYDRLLENMSAALSQGIGTLLLGFTSFAAIILCGALAVAVVLKSWALLSGPAENASQRFMRARVALQFTVVSMIAAMAYVSIF